jgi:hypothetical protein
VFEIRKNIMNVFSHKLSAMAMAAGSIDSWHFYFLFFIFLPAQSVL